MYRMYHHPSGCGSVRLFRTSGKSSAVGDWALVSMASMAAINANVWAETCRQIAGGSIGLRACVPAEDALIAAEKMLPADVTVPSICE